MGLESVEPAAAGPRTRRGRRPKAVPDVSQDLATRRADAAVQARGARPPQRWLPRIVVLCTLAGITVVLPLTGNVSPGNGTFVAGAQAAEPDMPATVDAVTRFAVVTTPPRGITAAVGAATPDEIAASRNDIRNPLPGCDPRVRPTGTNGQLDMADLCTLWDGHFQLRADAASALAELNLAFHAKFGRDLCLVDAYRDLARQKLYKATKGEIAAVPGKSNHGWGLAVDLCSIETSGPAKKWMDDNGAVYGWANPNWALPGGSGATEPWHWEYTRGVLADGEHYTS